MVIPPETCDCPMMAQAVSKVRQSAYTDQNISSGVPYDAFR